MLLRSSAPPSLERIRWRRPEQAPAVEKSCLMLLAPRIAGLSHNCARSESSVSWSVRMQRYGNGMGRSGQGTRCGGACGCRCQPVYILNWQAVCCTSVLAFFIFF
ncbi:UNVERIFIED_CONTAM: hypothetical protein Sangu_3047800 [Sesamum angustifolium]|uniref:Uncharacterized protein n=1 Tax=Sesamum angustifolium TaxID=2727405 RepID=A0AAW2KFJ0_9LAMI